MTKQLQIPRSAQDEFSAVDAFVAAAHFVHGRNFSPLKLNLKAFPLADVNAAASLGPRVFSFNMSGRCLLRGSIHKHCFHQSDEVVSFTLWSSFVPFTAAAPVKRTFIYDTHLDPQDYSAALVVPEPWMILDLDVHHPFAERTLLQRGVVTAVEYRPPVRQRGAEPVEPPLHSLLRISTMFHKDDFPNIPLEEK